jgi:cytochrome c2
VLAGGPFFVLGLNAMKYPSVAAVILLCLGAATGLQALVLQAERTSPYDLAVTGRLAGPPAGTRLYARWADLRALPTTELTLDGEFVEGPQRLTVVFLSDLWKALPVGDGADTLLATCGDGYCATYTSAFIGQYRPFLVLEINGQGPEHWPPPGLAFNPGPFVITVSTRLVPAAATFLDLEHKKPWAVTGIEVANFADRYRGIFSGTWASPPPAADRGRTIWFNSCASCHAGPPGTAGGTKAGRPFPVIAAYAGYDPSFFRKYVRNPRSLVASAKMEAHPHYTDAQLDDLIAFITLGLPSAGN